MLLAEIMEKSHLLNPKTCADLSADIVYIYTDSM